MALIESDRSLQPAAKSLPAQDGVTAMYAGRETVGGIPLRQVITIITLANLQLWLLSSMIASHIQRRVRDGQVALDLARPLWPTFRQRCCWGAQVNSASIPFSPMERRWLAACGLQWHVIFSNMNYAT